MKRTLLVGAAALAAALITTIPASAMLGVAPASSLAVQDDAMIQVKGGHGGHGHMGHHGGRGHHYGWGRGRGHHRGWGHHRHH